MDPKASVLPTTPQRPIMQYFAVMQIKALGIVINIKNSLEFNS